MCGFTRGLVRYVVWVDGKVRVAMLCLWRDVDTVSTKRAQVSASHEQFLAPSAQATDSLLHILVLFSFC